jgi:ribonuclease P protein component
MLQPENRLKKVRDFNLLMKYGHWLNGRFLDIKYVKLAKIIDFSPKNEEPGKFTRQLKLAFTVGLKIDKRAVVRNRLRRQMREVVRLLIKANKLQSGYYVILVAKKEILKAEYLDIKMDIETLLAQAMIML